MSYIDELIKKAQNKQLTEEEEEEILNDYTTACEKIAEGEKAKKQLQPVVYAILGATDKKETKNFHIYVTAYEKPGIDEKTLQEKYKEIYQAVKRIKAIVSLHVKRK